MKVAIIKRGRRKQKKKIFVLYIVVNINTMFLCTKAKEICFFFIENRIFFRFISYFFLLFVLEPNELLFAIRYHFYINIKHRLKKNFACRSIFFSLRMSLYRSVSHWQWKNFFACNFFHSLYFVVCSQCVFLIGWWISNNIHNDLTESNQ